MFQVGDTVVYGTIGVCTVEGITIKEIARVKKQYYVLRPMSQDNSAVYVPLDNEELLGRARRVLSPNSIKEAFGAARETELPWPENDAMRREQFAAVLAKGERSEQLRMLYAILYRQKQLSVLGKRLHVADERLLKEIYRLLAEEVAVSFGITLDDAMAYVVAETEMVETV